MKLHPTILILMNKIITVFILIIFILGCNQQTATSNGNKATNDSIEVIHFQDSLRQAFLANYDRSFNNLSQFMGGLPQTEEGVLKKLEKKENWKSYKSSFDSSWSIIEKTRLTPMKEWANEELTEANSNGKDLFYPFGGPDFLNAFTLFPHAKNYTLIGLEPVGWVPDLTKMKEKAQSDYLHSIYNALGDIFQRSYFITRKMVHDMHNNEISGTVPLLYVFLARTHNTIVDVKRVGINDQGTLEVYTVDIKNKPTKKISPGIRIDFIPENQTEVHSLYYFAINLLDAELVKTPGIMKYISGLGTVNTYVKSASYLMHYLTFNYIREAVLKQSAALLQDDSGIAYRFFDKKVWNFKFYGRYMKPVNDFNWVFEKDLQDVYKKDSTIKPVPFILGYHWESNGINLLRAVKKNDIANSLPKDTVGWKKLKKK